MINDQKIIMATKIYLKSYEQVLKEFHDPTFATQVATVVTMVLVKEESIQPVQNPLFALSMLLQNAASTKKQDKKDTKKPDKKPDQAADQKDGETHD